MSVTRGKFLKELGKSLPGMVLGSGVAAAAHKVLGKVAAASDVGQTGLSPAPATEKPFEAPVVSEVEFIKSGPADGNKMALTFDDGPTPGVTDHILDELKRRGLHATFFMIGERIVAAPELARRVLAEGHEVGNHTFTHPHLTQLPDKQADAEIQKTQDVMIELLNHRPKWFRPPYGELRQNQASMLTDRGLRIVIWNLDPSDWAQPGVEKISEVLTGAKPGSIALCHDVHRQTAEAIGPVLDTLLQRGFNPVTLSSLLE